MNTCFVLRTGRPTADFTQDKSDAGGKVEAKAPAQNAPIPAPKGKVDWSKYKNSTDFLNAFVENKGKVART